MDQLFWVAMLIFWSLFACLGLMLSTAGLSNRSPPPCSRMVNGDTAGPYSPR